VEYSGRDIRLGLVEASQNKIGTPVDQILLFCFHYDPTTGKYGAIAMNSLRAVGAAFVLVFGTCLFIFIRRDAKGSKRAIGRLG
jgi:protein SCO1/2